MIIAAFFNAVTTVNVFTASNNNLTLVKTQAVHFASPKSWSRFEKTNSTAVTRIGQVFNFLHPELHDVSFIPSNLKLVQ